MRIAVNSRRKDETGQWVDKPNYFSVTVWGQQGENCAQYLAKGRPVGIDGRLDWREWETPEGNKREAVEVVAESVQFLGSRGDGDGAAYVPAGATGVGAQRGLPGLRNRRRHSVLGSFTRSSGSARADPERVHPEGVRFTAASIV